MKYYLIAGETSGDLHGADLIRSLKELDANAQFRFWGGDLMKMEGGEMVQHYSSMAFMGFAEVVRHLPKVIAKINQCKKDLINYNPDALILIDYPGFNLRIAKYAKSKGIKVFYYISPKVWAWKESRVKLIKKVVDKMFVIFPFEKGFYNKWNYEVEYIGNPLLDIIDNHIFCQDFLKRNKLGDKPIIALLPGSRKQEVNKMLPLMLKLAPLYKDYQFVIAATSPIDPTCYRKFSNNHNTGVTVVFNATYDLLHHAKVALVTSGTATLETALLNVPQAVCYKTNPSTYWIAKSLIKIKYISLVNLILNKEAVKELIQHKCIVSKLEAVLKDLLSNSDYRKQMLEDYALLRNKLKANEKPSMLAARKIAECL